MSFSPAKNNEVGVCKGIIIIPIHVSYDNNHISYSFGSCFTSGFSPTSLTPYNNTPDFTFYTHILIFGSQVKLTKEDQRIKINIKYVRQII